MAENVDLFLALAEIGGVFVAFGALISVVRSSRADRFLVRGVVQAGLVVIAAALIPVGVSRYALEPSTTWKLSSAAFLALIWTSFIIPLRDRVEREDARAHAAEHRATVIVLGVSEVGVQTPLVLVLFGLFPVYASAFYGTALILNLLQAALQLSQLVLSRNASAE